MHFPFQYRDRSTDWKNMDDHHLRSILLNLHYRLSDNDRERLHFYLHNDAPRSLIDDSSLSGTLKLIQSLFDQDKINEKDFTFLIKAFKQIQCFDAAKHLEGSFVISNFMSFDWMDLEHQHRMHLPDHHQSVLSLASVMPLTSLELLDDNVDDRMAPDQCKSNVDLNDLCTHFIQLKFFSKKSLWTNSRIVMSIKNPLSGHCHQRKPILSFHG